MFNKKPASYDKFCSEKEIVNLPIDVIVPNPYQPRRVFIDEKINELAKSINQYGLIQPIVVRERKDGKYELVAGERRLRASKKLGKVEIKSIIMTAGEGDSAVIALIENIQRENLHFMEEAEAYEALLKDHEITQEELATRLGKNQSTIANKLRILRLSDYVKEAVIANRLTERHARALLRLHDEQSQLKLIDTIRKKNLSVKVTEELVEKQLQNLYEPKKAKNGKMIKVLRDYRLFMNSIKTVIMQMKQADIEAQFRQYDEDDHVRIEIIVNKPGSSHLTAQSGEVNSL